MKIIVTGGSGKLGAVVVRHLLSAGHEVLPIDVRTPPKSLGVETHCVNLCDVPALTKLFEGAGGICHLGNLPMIHEAPTTPGFINNIGATHAVFESAIAAKVPVVVNASSVQAYGVICSPGRGALPISIPKYLPIDEDHPHLPTDAYPLTKSMSEIIAEAFCRQDPRLSVVSLRFTMILAKKSPNASDAHRHKGSFSQTLYTAVLAEDAAHACRLSLERGSVTPGHVALNVISPQTLRPWTEASILELYGRIPEFREKLGPNDPLISARKAEQVLGFRAGPIYEE